MSSITGILLAAGHSQRFGSDKLLYPLQGVPMAIVSTRILKQVVEEVLVVIHPQTRKLAEVLHHEGVKQVICDSQGMGMSLACGVKASLHARGWLIALADMPFIQTTTIHKVVDLLQQGTPIVAPQYRGQRGHPVGFLKQFGPELCQLTGERGARELLQRHPPTLFDCEDAGILYDIDSVEDLNKRPE